jgi:hypothetical protein
MSEEEDEIEREREQEQHAKPSIITCSDLTHTFTDTNRKNTLMSHFD